MKPNQVLASIFWMASAAGSAQTLNLLVYDYAGMSLEQTAGMEEVAGRLLEKTGVTVSWTRCRGASALPEASRLCSRDLAANDFVIRIRAAGSAADKRQAVALASAVVLHQGGKYATILYSAVRSEASALQLPSSTLLGYTLAHEIGHCLLGPGHSAGGVMRPAWSRREAREMEQLRMAFSRAEAARIIASLQRPGA